ncbi:MAG: hypothetical protein ICV70_03735 [Jiangellaceae bacterium]|nr:hypothetical protein [Jiangellaceae bacterium]
MADQRLRRAWVNAARTVGWHRRLLAAGLAAGATALAIQAAQPAPEPTERVVAAAEDLPGGATLSAADLEVVDVPPALVPSGAFDSASGPAGRTLAGPVGAGEIVTEVRLVGPGLLAGWGENVATPVRIADPGAVSLLRAGDSIDLYAVPLTEPGPARMIAAGLPVLAVPAEDQQGMLAEGALVVVGTRAEKAAALAEASVTSRLSIVLRAR